MVVEVVWYVIIVYVVRWDPGGVAEADEISLTRNGRLLVKECGEEKHFITLQGRDAAKNWFNSSRG